MFLDYSLFTKKDVDSFTAVLVYVDDLLITSTHSDKIQELKNQLSSHFHMKDLEAGVLNSKPYKLHMDQHVKLQADSGTPLPDLEVYRRLIGKLVYLTITRPDICFIVQVLRQGVLFANSSAVYLTTYCDSDWASCPMSRRPTTGYCILLGESPLSWKSKKKSVVSRSSAEAKYRAMALTYYEVTWIVTLLKDLGLKDLEPEELKCDNQAAIHIAANLVFHARTKHIEVDCHYVRDQIKSSLIHPSYVLSKTQLVDVFTKVLPVDQHNTRLSKLGVSFSPK
ncbi:retrovirus-related pol polyprotein from transposon TNT 1-94 [Tanacetum coccineum]